MCIGTLCEQKNEGVKVSGDMIEGCIIIQVNKEVNSSYLYNLNARIFQFKCLA